MARPAHVAPFESCVACFKGDTTTAIALRGEAEWIVAGLVALGLPEDEAWGAFRSLLQAQGWEGGPDEVPDGTLTHFIRVCDGCVTASGTGWTAAPVDGEINLYGQPQGI